ncbi:hypothetical protein BKI52_32955 [marine bacterium AO1-C]|nr:hypothetical protein BKI52_32955 [marine bacterium AO1-C]
MLENITTQDAENINKLLEASYQHKLRNSSNPFLGRHMRQVLDIGNAPDDKFYLEKLLRAIQETLGDRFLNTKIIKTQGRNTTEIRITSDGLLNEFLERGGFVNVLNQEQERKKQEEEDKQAADKLAKLDLEIKELQKDDLVYKKGMQALEKKVKQLQNDDLVYKKGMQTLEKKVKSLQKTNLYMSIGLAVATALTLAFNFGKLLAILGVY